MSDSLLFHEAQTTRLHQYENDSLAKGTECGAGFALAHLAGD